MNLRALEAARLTHYGISPAQRLTTLPDAARFIGRVGFCWLFAPADHKLELPSLFEMVKGKRDMHIEDWDTDSDRLWGWKSDLPAARRAYYGKALVGKPAFISLKMLPYALAAMGAERIEELYAAGGISHDARKIYTTLDAAGAQPTMTLRRNAGFEGKTGSARFHRALDELQRHLVVMPMGATNEVGNWPSQIFELVARWFPAQAAEARTLDLDAARRALIERYLKTVLAAPLDVPGRLFNIPRADAHNLLDDLIHTKQIRLTDNWLIHRSAKFNHQ